MVALLNPQEDHNTAQALLKLVAEQLAETEKSLTTMVHDRDMYLQLVGHAVRLRGLLVTMQNEYNRRTHK